MIRVGVIGAAGKMGREVCSAVLADPDLHLVAAVDVTAGSSVGELVGGDSKVKISDELEMLSDAEVEVAVDFTHPGAVMDNVRWCVRHGVHAVVGTTGITPSDLEEIVRLIDEEGNESNVFVAPNFAIGAVLMMKFSATAARYLPSVEIIEMHHQQKADAPSGTALKTAEEIAAALGETGAPGDASKESIPGVRGGKIDGVTIHSVRLSGLVAHQEVLLGGPGQLLTIRHDSFDRASFMPGVLLAVKAISTRPGLTYGLEHLLDI
jgi:4-hydroxy-tetrahydrodipicolinate reductase